MFSIKRDNHTGYFIFRCPECKHTNGVEPWEITISVCAICGASIYPHIDNVMDSALYRVAYHFNTMLSRKES